MKADGKTPVLAIGIDAGEFGLLDGLVHEGCLPSLGPLWARGQRGRVVGPANIGSGAVWPTFASGAAPQQHQFYSDLAWASDRMRVERASFDHVTPFWKRLAREGVSCAVLDVPFTAAAMVPGCAEVLDWGAHDWLGGHPVTFPATVSRIVEAVGAHPFARRVATVNGPEDQRALRRVVRDCVVGARQRGRLAADLLREHPADLQLIVFTELHRASHFLWHTVQPARTAQDTQKRSRADSTASLEQVLVEIDRQIGRLVEQAGADTAVFIFSLHGMRESNGLPCFLDALLEAWGIAVRSPPSGRESWSAQRLVRAARVLVPTRLRTWCHRWMTRSAVMRLARPEDVMPSWNWERTRAFSLPTDQHGWVRINLAGREACGIVPLGAYERTCRELEGKLRGLRTANGRPVVDDVLRIHDAPSRALSSALPDLVVHWSDAVLESPLVLESPHRTFTPCARKLTGQHAVEGGYVFRPPRNGVGDPLPRVLAAESLHHLLERLLRYRRP